MSKKSVSSFDEDNASTLVDLLLDKQTAETTRLAIINELNETQQEQSFFETMFNEELSLAPCPHCEHINHWLIPEDVLVQMGWVTYKQDKRIPQNTDSSICKEFSEACKKKKTYV